MILHDSEIGSRHLYDNNYVRLVALFRYYRYMYLFPTSDSIHLNSCY